MKASLSIAGLTSLILQVVLLAPSTVFAADCSAQDQIFPWGQEGVNLIWYLREYACINHWWKDIRITPSGPACWNSEHGPCWSGWIYMRGHPSQQQCWNVLEQIINQCMWARMFPDNQYHTTNGGWWEWGSEYSESWFYPVSPPGRRSIADETTIPASNFSLTDNGPDGTTLVVLDIDRDGKVLGVASDITIFNDGSQKDNLA